MTTAVLPIEHGDSWEVSRDKINNSFNQLSAEFRAVIPNIRDWEWYIWDTPTWIDAAWDTLELSIRGDYLAYKTSSMTSRVRLYDMTTLKWEKGDQWKPWPKWDPWKDGTIIDDITWEVRQTDNKVVIKVWHDDSDYDTYVLDIVAWGGWTSYDIISQQDINNNSQTARTVSWEAINWIIKNAILKWMWNGARMYYIKDDGNTDTSSRTAYIIDPSTMTAIQWAEYTPQSWDIIFCYFTYGCKIWGQYSYKDSQQQVITIPDSPNPSIAIQWNTSKAIYANGNLADYYHFHIWAWAWIMFLSDNNGLHAINTEEVVDIYDWEAWRLVDAIRELKRTRVDITQAQYEALELAWTVDPTIYYHIIQTNGN